MCGQTTPPGGRHFLDPRNQRAFVDYEVGAIDVRQSIDRTLSSVSVCGSQPTLRRGRLVSLAIRFAAERLMLADIAFRIVSRLVSLINFTPICLAIELGFGTALANPSATCTSRCGCPANGGTC